MRLIIDLTNAPSTDSMQSTPKGITKMDKDDKIKARRPLHRRACEFNVFYNPNLLPVKMTSKQQEKLKDSNDIDHYNRFFVGNPISVSSYDGSECMYPISVIGDGGDTGGVNKPKIDKENPSCVKYFNNLYQKFDEYFDSTTLHGLKYVGDSNLSILERLFWFCSFIAGCCFAIYFIVSLYQKFDHNPMVIGFDPKLVFLAEIPFPAITICNVNLVLKSKAEQIENSGNSTLKSLLLDICNVKTNENGAFDEESTTEWSVVQNFIIDVNQNCMNMIKRCTWSGTNASCDDLINPVLTDEGFCCSFNSLPLNMTLRGDFQDMGNFPEDIINWNPEDGYAEDTPLNYYPYRGEGPGQSLGLSLVLDAQLHEYYCTSTNSIGFKILLANPTERPKIAEVGYLLSPGDESRIAILPDVKQAAPNIRSIHVDKRQCFFARERMLKYYTLYSEKNCRLECQTNYTLELCNCVPFYLPRNASTPICNKAKENCTNTAKDTIERFTKERRACKCLPGCNEVSFKIDSITTGKIKTKFNTTSPDMLGGVKYDYFACVVCLFSHYHFVTNTGGLLGLFLGFSFLSAVEIFYFIFFRSPIRYYRKRREIKLREKKQRLKLLSKMPYIR